MLEIRKTTDPILREPTLEVSAFDEELQKLIDGMIETMRAQNGIGLAAPQVGISQKILVCEFAGDEESKIEAVPLTILCNPEIIESSTQKKVMVEGCLSFPGLELLVKRPSKVKIKGKDRYGKEIVVEADKLHARVLQHEVDHLNCTLFTDHLREIDTIFIGTGTLGAPSLEALANDLQYKIKLVVTGDATAVSRSKGKVINPIEVIAKKYNLPLLKTKDINDPAVVEKIKKSKPVLGIMADFGQIIRPAVLEIPKHGILNIHPSLLPKYRGPSPIQETILSGDRTSGVSLILTSTKMDAGGIISQIKVGLTGSETSSILKEFLAKVAATHLLNTIPYYIARDLRPVAQNENKATYTRLFTKEDGLVDENTIALEVERKIRAFDTWPKVYTIAGGKRVTLLASHFDKEGNFQLDRVKPEGKNEMTYADFERGYHTTLTFKQ